MTSVGLILTRVRLVLIRVRLALTLVDLCWYLCIRIDLIKVKFLKINFFKTTGTEKDDIKVSVILAILLSTVTGLL